MAEMPAAASQQKALSEAILRLLDERGEGKTICPSEAAKAVAGEDAWRGLMEDARTAARKLAHVGKIVITQHGKDVGDGEWRGPVRLMKRN